MKTRILAALAAAALAAAQTAHAGPLSVTDAGVLRQVTTEAELAGKQLTQLEGQLRAQLNMVRNLPQTIAPDLFNAAAQAQQLTQQISGLQSNIEGIRGQMQSLYPSNFSGGPDDILSRVASMRQTEQTAYTQAQQANAQAIETQRRIGTSVQQAASASQGAVGQLQAQQAGNQMLAALSAQLQTMNASQASVANALAQTKEEQAAEIKAGQADITAANQPVGGGSMNATP